MAAKDNGTGKRRAADSKVRSRNRYAAFALRSRRWVLIGLVLAAAVAGVVSQLR